MSPICYLVEIVDLLLYSHSDRSVADQFSFDWLMFLVPTLGWWLADNVLLSRWYMRKLEFFALL